MPIAYVMSRFPHLPETFILREMNALEDQGWAIRLYPLVRQRQAVLHTDARKWLPRAHRFPAARLAAGFLRQLAKAPVEAARLWARMVWGHRRSPAFLARALYIFPYALAMADEMRVQGVRHIHAHYATHPALAAWLIHHLTGISYSVTVHAHDIFVNRTMLTPKLRDAAFVVAISRYNQRFLTRVLGAWVADKTHIVHCGIDPVRYQPKSPTPQGAPLHIVSVGSLQAYKGQRHLVAACALLYENHIPFQCQIIGEGEERAALQAQIADAGLEARVKLAGAKTEAEVAAALAAANCYVQPSVQTESGKMEGIPVALMEALATGLPVIASELSGIPELVTDGETGYLALPGDAQALATALRHVYEHRAEAQNLAAAGRARVLEAFNLHATSRQMGTLFAAALAQAGDADTGRARMTYDYKERDHSSWNNYKTP